MNNETATEIRITNDYLEIRQKQMKPGDATLSTYNNGQQEGKAIFYVDADGKEMQITSMRNEMGVDGVLVTTFTDMAGNAFHPTF